MNGVECAIITGVSGQDGQFMAHRLLAHDVRVIGLTRDVQCARAALPDDLVRRIELLAWDLRDQPALEEILAIQKPAMLFNFAALSSGAGMFDDAPAIAEINGVAVACILEAIRKVDPSVRFCQASSSEMFGEPAETPQRETTPFCPLSPYGAAKLYAHCMADIYRRHHGLFACSAILFNHESRLRGLGFVTRKVTYNAARIKLGLARRLELGNLESRRDWGFAGDYVEAMHLMLRHRTPGDYVIATGIAHSVRELCEVAFSHLGLDYRDHVVEDVGHARRADPVQRVGDPSRAREVLGWRPGVEFAELVRGMVDADLELLSRAPA